MFFDKVKEYFEQTNFTLRGANMDDKEGATFGLPSKFLNLGEDGFYRMYHGPFGIELNEDQLKMLKKYEQNVIENYEKASKITDEEITPLKITDNKIDIEEGLIFHRCIANMDTLKGISVAGVLPSEFFGAPESEKEGVFCGFFSKIIKSDNPILERYRAFRDAQRKPSRNYVMLYFDSKNPIAKEIASVDYFQYEEEKNHSPEIIEKKYSKETRELFDTLIEPFSGNGKDAHDLPPHKQWMAIPGGLPPQLINGVCINNEVEFLMNNIDKIREMFPNATIFDQENTVIATPLTWEAKSKNEDIIQ